MEDILVRLVVFSICHNEEKTIGHVLDGIPSRISGITSILRLVVDDGSTDKTAIIAKRHGAIVIANRGQKKLAYCFQMAAEKCLEMGADVAVGIDGDMQFKSSEIPKLVGPILKNVADCVVGNRFIDPKTEERRRPANMPLSKYYGNVFAARIIGMMSARKFQDITCGFRAYNRKALLNLNLNGNYTYTQESFQILVAKKLDIIQVPVYVKYFPNRKSRVVASSISFMIRSSIDILRTYRDFAAMIFFGIPGLVCLLVGFGMGAYVGVWFLMEGSFFPYKFVGLLGIYIFSVGLILWVLALVADMLGRMRKTQEKILTSLKVLRYGETGIIKSKRSSIGNKNKRKLRSTPSRIYANKKGVAPRKGATARRRVRVQ